MVPSALMETGPGRHRDHSPIAHDGVAGCGDQLAVARNLEGAVARVHRAIGGLDDEEAGPLNGSIEVVAGLLQRALALIKRGPAQDSETIHDLAERRLG